MRAAPSFGVKGDRELDGLLEAIEKMGVDEDGVPKLLGACAVTGSR
jgi:hypothetical protein